MLFGGKAKFDYLEWKLVLETGSFWGSGVDIQSKLPEVPIRDVDKPFWTLSRRGVFVSAETWEHMRQKKQEVNWWSVVWFPQAIPKQSFILWLAILNRLTTGERLVI